VLPHFQKDKFEKFLRYIFSGRKIRDQHRPLVVLPGQVKTLLSIRILLCATT
jgi:hypothetical protein